MKKTKKELLSQIKSKTIIFVVIVLMVSILKSIFGDENSMLAVTSIVLMLVLSQMNLTMNPVKNLISLIVLNLILGLSAFLSSQYLIIGLVLNFIILLFIGYHFTYELKKPVNMVIGLHYMLLLTNPVTITQLPRRILLLIVGAFMIMSAQMLANKNKLIKSRKQMFNNILDAILLKIELLKSNKDSKKADDALISSIDQLKVTIFESGKTNSHLTECGANTINILSSLEKIVIILDNMTNKTIEVNLLNEIHKVINAIKNNEPEITTNNFEDKFKESDLSYAIDIFDFINSVKILNIEMKKFNEVSNNKNNCQNELSIPNEFMKLNIKKNITNIQNTRVTYGLRLGLLFSLTFFIVNYFNLQHGEWAVYTVFALIQPHLEFTVTKSKKRMFGTIIGAIIIAILFNLTPNIIIRMLILILAGYSMSYISDYKYLAICITVCSIASAGLAVPNANSIILTRVIFVIIGILIAIIANKFILPRRLSDEEENLNNIQKESSRKMMDEVLLNEGNENESVIGILSLVPSLINLRTQYLTQNGLNMNKYLIKKNGILMNDLLQMHLLTKDDNKDDNNYGKLLNKIKKIIATSTNIGIMKTKISITLESVNNIKEKLLLLKVSKILSDVELFGYKEEDQTDLYKFLTIFN